MNDLFEFRLTAEKLKKIYDLKCAEIMGKYSLRRTDMDVLWLIYISGNDKTANAIAEAGMSKSNVSKSVENLKRNNLISLEADDADRRYIHMHLKTSAYDIVNEIAKIRTEISGELFDGISDKDKELFKKIRNNIEDNIDKKYGMQKDKYKRENCEIK